MKETMKRINILDILKRGYSDDANYADIDNEVVDKLLDFISEVEQEAYERGEREMAERLKNKTIEYIKDKWEIRDIDCENALDNVIEKELKLLESK